MSEKLKEAMEITATDLYDEYVQVINDLHFYSEAENVVAHIRLADGRTGEVSIRITTDPESFIVPEDED